MSEFSIPPREQWEPYPVLNIDRVSLEELKLIFSQTEKHLDYTVKQGESLASKTMSIITLMVGLLIALSGYIISAWKSPFHLTNDDLAAIFGCLYILGILIYIINNIMTYKYSATGSQPDGLTSTLHINNDVSQDKMLLLMYLNEIHAYDWRIENNSDLNRKRWRRYRISVFLFLFFPFVLVLFYGLLKWLRRGD